MADTKGDKGLEQWQKVISAMKQLNPATVIPAHYLSSDYNFNIVLDHLYSA